MTYGPDIDLAEIETSEPIVLRVRVRANVLDGQHLLARHIVAQAISDAIAAEPDVFDCAVQHYIEPEVLG